jgi:hypothetical protein
MIDRRFQVADIFALVAEHDKLADLDPFGLQQLRFVLNIFDVGFALHGIKNALRAAFGPDPEAGAGQLGQGLDDLIVETVGPADTLEGDFEVALLQLVGEFQEPARVNGENIVGVPELVGLVARAALNRITTMVRSSAGASPAV